MRVPVARCAYAAPRAARAGTGAPASKRKFDRRTQRARAYRAAPARQRSYWLDSMAWRRFELLRKNCCAARTKPLRPQQLIPRPQLEKVDDLERTTAPSRALPDPRWSQFSPALVCVVSTACQARKVRSRSKNASCLVSLATGSGLSAQPRTYGTPPLAQRSPNLQTSRRVRLGTFQKRIPFRRGLSGDEPNVVPPPVCHKRDGWPSRRSTSRTSTSPATLSCSRA